MSGAINFLMADIYGGGYAGTGEFTVPEPDDHNALVDDKEVAETVSQQTKNKTPVFMALLLIVILAFVIGVVKK